MTTIVHHIQCVYTHIYLYHTYYTYIYIYVPRGSNVVLFGYDLLSA